jgi:hypothetical protein
MYYEFSLIKDGDSPLISSNQTLVDSLLNETSASSLSVQQTEPPEASCSIQGDAVTHSPLVLSREQCTCMAKILQCIHQIVVILNEK